MDLIYKNEKKLFLIAAVISSVFWIAITIGTIGIVLVYLLLGYVFFLFAHSAFISHLKGSGVRISQDQSSDLYEKLVKGCENVGLKDVPEAYLLRTDYFNALATKFLGRHFVVLFSDVVDALKDHPGAIDFYIGHELGHIHRKHLSWGAFIMPATILPVLGTALRRAEEYTCDRYGVACCQSEDDIKFAIAALAAGDTRWKTINIDSYIKQVELTSGFWMSFHELTSDYPWLTKRLSSAIALRKNEAVKHPRRSIFAWILSCFIPRFGAGGASSLIITIALIGVLAAIALPAYQAYTEKVRMAEAHTSSFVVKDRVSDYVLANNTWPVSMTDLDYETEVLNFAQNKFEIGIYDNGMIGINVGVADNGETKYIVLEPELSENDLTWKCYGQNIDTSLLPASCQ
jgi:Zn-dependent protease with chaperone function